MTDQHPITPPPELVLQWWEATRPNIETSVKDQLCTQAARWGADQELEACCVEVEQMFCWGSARDLRAARRPNPPSLKEQALAALYRADKDVITNPITGEVVDLRTILSKEQSDTIRRAIEALPNG
jgi:hypothetical protein